MRPENRTVEQELARIAAGAHGIVTRAELLAAGISEGGIKRRVRKGILLPEYRGVYRVGHRAPSVEADYMAAVRACGRGSILSGSAAAFLTRLVKGLAPPPEVTTPTERRIAGITTRRSRLITARYATSFSRIPVTTTPCVLVDLSAVLNEWALARACHEAGVLYRTTPAQVDRVLRQRPSASGAAVLRAILRGDVNVTLSKLERAFLRLLRNSGLPLPRTNKVASGRRVDCRWPEYRLTVELDSYTFHNSRYAWEQDRRREREARGRGDEFRRYTDGDVFEDPSYMLSELRPLFYPIGAELISVIDRNSS
jgi:hypothetical protein